MLNIIERVQNKVEQFREWNHARLAEWDLRCGPISKREKEAICRKLGPISDRGVTVLDPAYQARLQSVRGDA